MKRKLNSSLIIAAAGSGKTTELIKQIIQKAVELPNDKYLAVITYTNSATNEILERLKKEISIQSNIFVGTIHSFLIKFLIKPYGKVLGLVPNELIITDYEVKINKTSSNFSIEKNMIAKHLSEQGVLTYDYVVTLSKKILNNEEVKKRFCNRIMYLFVDEFQDATKTQFEIFEVLRKGKKSEVILVGDPEQRIMNFRNKFRKGKVVTDARKVTLHPIDDLQKKKTYSISKLNCNYRSSETIVNFINHFHSSINQEWANKEITSKNPIMFIKSIKLTSIISDFNDLCVNKKCCGEVPKTRFFLAYENKVFNNYRKADFNQKSKENLPIFTCITEFLSAFYNIKKEQLPQFLKLEEIELRKKFLLLFFEINNNINLDIEKFVGFVELTFNHQRQEIVPEIKFNINDRTKKLFEELSNKMHSVKEEISNELNEFQDSFLTIHKSKGLQADAVLVVAKNEKELLMWLEDDQEKRLLDQQDKCRLGYVAFSRPRELLCIACLTPISEPTQKLLNKFDVLFYLPSKEQNKTVIKAF